MNSIVIATRGSPLALWQANQVSARLKAVHPGITTELHTVRTQGDRVTGQAIATLSATGVFTREVDEIVLKGEAHVAVHSLKDQTTTLPAGLDLEIVLPRGPVEDVVVGRTAPRLQDLPKGARVATGSLRRRAQLLRLWPALVPVDIRGNVDTRVKKLAAGEADALLLARAGLERLGLGARITQVMTVEEMVPAVSQGIVGVTFRVGDDATRKLLHAAADSATRARALAERAFLKRLEGGCNVPAGGHATVDGDRLRIVARVLSLDGVRVLEDRREGPIGDAARLGEALAEALIARGADQLVKECRA